jgi:membrane protein YdbS with pleckstrin-like domain
MRVVSIVLVLWLIIGAVAAGQRHYYSSSNPNCSRVGNIALTILAGPLNYVGVNPKVDCHTPRPSK